MTRRLNLLLLLSALLVGLPAWWLLVENHPRNPAPQPITIARLRGLSESLAGPRPHAVQLETLARRHVTGTLAAAGIGFAPRPVALIAWRLPVDGGPAVVIGGAESRRTAAAADFNHFDPVAARRAAAARAEPGAVLLPAEPSPAAPRAVAPGVVVIPATGLRPGEQMVYVRLAGGRELLFALEVSPLEHNWRELRAPSRWLGQWRYREDRNIHYRWLATIRAWQAQAPGLQVIPGADAGWLDGHVARPPFAGRFPG